MAGEIVTRPILLMQIRGYGPRMGPRRVAALDVLRRKLGVYADDYIQTVTGIGYRFRPFLSRN